jgi:hypothetical protein
MVGEVKKSWARRGIDLTEKRGEGLRSARGDGTGYEQIPWKAFPALGMATYQLLKLYLAYMSKPALSAELRVLQRRFKNISIDTNAW